MPITLKLDKTLLDKKVAKIKRTTKPQYKIFSNFSLEHENKKINFWDKNIIFLKNNTENHYGASEASVVFRRLTEISEYVQFDDLFLDIKCTNSKIY